MLKRLFKPSHAGVFRTRSAARDIETDVAALLAVARAIDVALEKSQAEHAGLRRRMDDVVSRAAMVGGNEIEEHQAHSDSRSAMLHESDVDIRYAERRLVVIENNISHFKHLKTDLQNRFPDIKISNGCRILERD